MKKIWILTTLLYLGGLGHAAQENDLKIWEEFVTLLENKQMTVEKIKGEYVANEQLLEWIKGIKSQNTFEEMISNPEIFRVENKVHFLKSLNEKNTKVDYLFSFIIEEGHWYFHHLEAIFIRLDKIGTLPTKVFPDIPESQKIWARNEIQVSKMIQLWTFLAKRRSKEDAFNYFKDGPGFFVGAKTWVPFVPPPKAFTSISAGTRPISMEIRWSWSSWRTMRPWLKCSRSISSSIGTPATLNRRYHSRITANSLRRSGPTGPKLRGGSLPSTTRRMMSAPSRSRDNHEIADFT